MHSLPKRILFVDDDAETAQLMVLFLKLSGYEVTPVHTVADGLSQAARERFDLYLLDGLLRDGSGFDLCHQLRGFDPNTPILFFSALSYDEGQRRSLAAGAQGYLHKPDDIERLEPAISQLLKQAETRRLY